MAQGNGDVRCYAFDEHHRSSRGFRPYLDSRKAGGIAANSEVVRYRMLASPPAQSPVSAPLGNSQTCEMRLFPSAEPVVLSADVSQRLFIPGQVHQSARMRSATTSSISVCTPSFLTDRASSSLLIPRVMASIR